MNNYERDDMQQLYRIALDAVDRVESVAGSDTPAQDLRARLVAFADEHDWLLWHVPTDAPPCGECGHSRKYHHGVTSYGPTVELACRFETDRYEVCTCKRYKLAPLPHPATASA